MKKITIAIDGHSSCGKSTMAKDLAREVGYVYVDTGAMYRSVTLFALRNGLFTNDTIDEEELRRRMPEIQIFFICEWRLLRQKKAGVLPIRIPWSVL